MNTLRLVLTKLGRHWFRKFPTAANQKFLRDQFRKWCVAEDLLTWTKEGFWMRVSPHNYNTYEIYFLGWYDFYLTTWMKAHVPEGGVCWDIGAAEGWFTLLMGRLVGSSGRVDAFEAFPANYRKLQENIELNDMFWTHVNNIAISNYCGTAWFVPPSDDITHHLKYVEDNSGVGYLTVQERVLGSIEVPVTTLDSYTEVNRIARLDVIKMDIEGAEVAALQGAQDTIRGFRPYIIVEYNREALRRAGTSIEELSDLLDSYGYECYTFGRQLKRLRLESYYERPDNEVVFNVYCYPRR